MSTPDWMDAALCRHYPEIEFVPDVNAHTQQAIAIAVCKHCPVRSDCLEYALDSGDMGVWGGTVEVVRRRIRRDRNRRTAA